MTGIDGFLAFEHNDGEVLDYRGRDVSEEGLQAEHPDETPLKRGPGEAGYHHPEFWAGVSARRYRGRPTPPRLPGGRVHGSRRRHRPTRRPAGRGHSGVRAPRLAPGLLGRTLPRLPNAAPSAPGTEDVTRFAR